jgi:uncharacterized protein YdhG (YjbR/CyaY superfamily)
MAATKSPSKFTKARTTDKVWTAEEKAAMKDSARERKSHAKLSPADERAAGEAEIQAKIADMPVDDAAMAKRIHELVLSTAPNLVPTTYYGMPSYAKDGKVICFFQPKSKFKVRYSTFGFQPIATIDDGEMWPVAFAVEKLTPSAEAQLAKLVKKAAG